MYITLLQRICLDFIGTHFICTLSVTICFLSRLCNPRVSGIQSFEGLCTLFVKMTEGALLILRYRYSSQSPCQCIQAVKPGCCTTTKKAMPYCLFPTSIHCSSGTHWGGASGIPLVAENTEMFPYSGFTEFKAKVLEWKVSQLNLNRLHRNEVT